jgi:hypothetical protein
MASKKEPKMKTPKTKASKKVLKKLSAVRAVLPKDERDVLDAIVLGEVVAHTISKRPTRPTRPTRPEVAGHSISKRPTRPTRPEVAGHSISKRPTRPTRPTRPEVAGHSISKRPTRPTRPTRPEVAGHSVKPTEGTVPPITFDPDLEEYHPVQE